MCFLQNVWPREHRYTRLVVHNRVIHNGVKETLTEVRSRYWIIKGRVLIKQVMQECRTCLRLQSKPFQAPPPPLPAFRVQEAPPFTCTGVDYAGPVHVKISSEKSCTQKTWICLFTCCVTTSMC